MDSLKSEPLSQVPPLIVIVGPTASGKSRLGMAVARRFNGEIICADSRTIYKGMDIGTAKPTQEERQEIKHHLLDIVSPDQYFSAAEFKKLANQAIPRIVRAGRLPIMVGGSGLYIDSVLFDYQFAPAAHPATRAYLEKLTTEELQRLCLNKQIPLPENAKNRRHLIRTIETGGFLPKKHSMRPNTLVVGLAVDKAALFKNVTDRAEQMVRNGVLDEMRLLGRQYGWNSEAMTGNIYRAFRGVLQGQDDLSIAKGKFIRADWLLAKRQLTWFKRNPRIKWGSSDELMTVVERFVSQLSCKRHL